MKSIFVFIISFLSLIANAQICIPDSSIKKPGIYPKDSILPDAEATIHYEYTLTIIVPTDTEAIVFGNKQKVLIDSISLFRKIDFPAWLDIVCDGKCTFAAADTGCALLSGTPPDSIPDTTYVMGFVTKTFARLEAAPTVQFTQIDSIKGYWTLHLNNPFYNGVDQSSVREREIRARYGQGRLTIRVNDVRQGLSEIHIYAINGQEFYRQTLNSGYLHVNTEGWPRGIYLIRYVNGGKSESVKVLVF